MHRIPALWPAVRAGPEPAWCRPGAGGGAGPAARARARWRASARPVVAHAARRDRAPARGRGRPERPRHPGGPGRAPRAAAGGAALRQDLRAALQDPLLDRDRLARPGVLSRARAVSDGEPAAGRRPGRERHAAALQGHLADRPPGIGHDTRGPDRGRPAAAGLSADPGRGPAGGRARGPCGAGRAAGGARVAGRSLARTAAMALLRRCAASHPPAGRRGRDRARCAAAPTARVRRAARQPAGAGPPARPHRPRRRPRVERDGSPEACRARRTAFPPDRGAAARAGRDRRRSRGAQPHAAPAPGRRRQRQDPGSTDGDAARDRGRLPGGAARADRNFGQAACADADPPAGAGRSGADPAHRPRARRKAQAPAG